MSIKKYIFICICILIHQNIKAQDSIIQIGKIIYERTLYLHSIENILLNENKEMSEMEKHEYLSKFNSNYPNKITHTFELNFNDSISYYKPILPIHFGNSTLLNIAHQNIVYQSPTKSTFQAKKNILESEYFIADSLPTIKWKITNEFRTIAGYECRRVNGLWKDSIYVVAFYTDAINFSGGPELFHGLPGIILGLAIPSMHLNWFATTVIQENNISLQFPITNSNIQKSQFIELSKEVLKRNHLENNAFILQFIDL